MFDFEKIGEATYKSFFWVVTAFMFLFMLWQSRNYGMNWDEYSFVEYGKDLLNFYLALGKESTLQAKYNSPNYEISVYYGGMVELITEITNRIFSSRDPFDNHHLVTAIFGFIGVVFCGLTAKEISNWRTAIISSCFLFVTPVFFANSMHNSKDIPFAVGNITALYFIIVILKKWPNVKWYTYTALALAIAVTIGIRVGGILLIAYTCLFFVAKIFYLYLEGEIASKKEAFYEIKKGVLPLGLTVLAGYLVSLLFWPYAFFNPKTAPTNAFKFFSNIYYFDSYNLFEGAWIHRWEIPWYYIPKWIAITTPLFISLTPILLVILLVRIKNNLPKQLLLFSAMLLFTSLFPIIFIIIKKSNVYDGWRHLYFVYPPLVVICSIIWEKLFSVSSKQIQKILSITLLIFILQPFFFMLRNHPNEQFYFSPLIGGIEGAFKNYEIDYYGTSIRGAIEWIAKNPDVIKSSNKIRINSLYGGHNNPKHYINKYPQLVYVDVTDSSDYSLVLPSIAKNNHDLLANWPPKNTVHEIKVDGVPIIAIVKNLTIEQVKKDLPTSLKSTDKLADVTTFINLSLEFYQQKDYFNSIITAEKALSIDPQSAIAYNNICTSFNDLFLFDEAIEAGKKATQIAPDFVLAKNNYQYALSKKDTSIDPKIKMQSFLNLSFAFYNAGNQEKTIEFANKVLAIDQNNIVAYNNLCVAYIQLKEFDKAIVAAETALKIAPDFALAKNNLAWAKSQKNK